MAKKKEKENEEIPLVIQRIIKEIKEGDKK